MNILMLTHEFPPYPGGVGRYCSSLAHAATRAGHTVTVLAPQHGQASHADSADFAVRRFPGDVFHFKELTSLRSHINQVLDHRPGPRFDVVHAADWPAIVALRAIKTPGAQRVATLHGSDILLLKHSIRARLARAGTALRSFDKLACNSAYTQGLLREHFPHLVQRSLVTPLGVDDDWFNPASLADQASFGQRIGHQPNDLIVLTVARLDSRKGQLTSIEALSQLPAALKQRVHYVCVGKEVEAGYGNALSTKAEQKGVRLTLTGRLPDGELKAAYTLAHVFALTGESVPTKVEGFGLVLLEAAAQGLPAVVTQLQALPEVVAHGKTGWVCPDGAALVRAFDSALTQAAQGTLGGQCIEHAKAYTWDRCADLTYSRP